MVQAAGSPGLIARLWLLGLLFALPATMMLSGSLHRSVGHRLVADRLVDGFDYSWFGEFEHQAEGLATTFRPSIVGVGAFLDNLEVLLRGDLFAQTIGIVTLGCLFTLAWTFLLGGVLTRLRGPAGRSPAGLITAGGRYFRRMLVLALLGAPAYYAIYRSARWLFPRLEELTRDVTSESLVLGVYLLATAALVALLGFVRLTLDFARVAVVVDERKGALGAWWAGVRFVVGHPLKTTGVLIVFALLGAAVLLVYSRVAPGGRADSWLLVGAAVAVGQLFLALRLYLKLSLYGAELALYESSRR